MLFLTPSPCLRKAVGKGSDEMELKDLRKKIDEVDEKLLSALEERSELILEVAEQKKKSNSPVYDPVREQEIIEELSKKSVKFPKKHLRAVYTEIMSASRELEQPLKISFLGPEATFTNMAALKKFGSSSELVAMNSISDVFKAVEKDQADYGVVPIENSTEGTVTHTVDMFLYSDLQIVAEISLEINHNLISKYKLSEIKRVYSNPQALAQCREWLSKNLPKAELIEASSTAKAAELAQLYHSSAAIASELAAEKFKLNILAPAIEDSPHNTTRFLVIGKKAPPKAKRSKTSIVYSVPHKSGALFDSLEPINKNNLNMTKIESRPTKQKQWEYVFFIDFTGHVEDEEVKKAMDELKKRTAFLKILGSYPRELNGD